MPPVKKPAAVLRASGSRHYTKAELDERERAEVKVPKEAKPKKVKAPTYLPPNLTRKFNSLAKTLVKMGILTALDADVLARYLIAEQNYLAASQNLVHAMRTGNTVQVDKWSAIQDRFFKQCRATGADLGLSVSSRCNLEIPPQFAAEAQSAEEAALFGD